MTNCDSIHEEIQRQSAESGDQKPRFRSSAVSAGRYSATLCRAICRGLAREIEHEEFGLMRLVEVHRLCQAVTVHPRGDHEVEGAEMYALDDVTGEVLDPKKVMEARAQEIAYIQHEKVWKRISRSDAAQQGWKVV